MSTRALALLFGLAFASSVTTASAASCPPKKVPCPALKKQLAQHRNQLTQVMHRVESAKDPSDEDEEVIEKELDAMSTIVSCMHCDKAVRSEALRLQASYGGLLAEHYDRLGSKKVEHGRLAYNAAREAARVDPSNLGAQTQYGQALIKISKKRMRSRVVRV